MDRPIVLVGAGGHGISCLELIDQAPGFRSVGYLDKGPVLVGIDDQYPYLGDDDKVEELAAQGHSFLIGVGQIGGGAVRERMFRELTAKNAELPALISPKAAIAKFTTIGIGTAIFQGAIINRASTIGDGCIVNSGALIEHGAQIGSFVHVATRACVNGDVKIGNRAMIGSCAVLRQGIEIAENVVVGMGSVVTKSLVEPGVYFGNPARKVENNV